MEWVEGAEAVRPKRKSLSFKRNRGYFGIRIKDIEDVTYNMNLKKDGISLGEHIITMSVVHKPTLSNYWHCEIVLYAQPVKANSIFQMGKRKLLDITSKTVVESVGEEMLSQLKPKFILSKDISDNIEHLKWNYRKNE